MLQIIMLLASLVLTKIDRQGKVIAVRAHKLQKYVNPKSTLHTGWWRISKSKNATSFALIYPSLLWERSSRRVLSGVGYDTSGKYFIFSFGKMVSDLETLRGLCRTMAEGSYVG